jgi:hypothetical protein
MGDARDGAIALVKGGVHVQSIEPRFQRVCIFRGRGRLAMGQCPQIRQFRSWNKLTNR